MLSRFLSTLVVPAFLFLSCVDAMGAQVDLTAVGHATPLSSKSKICNILDYGGVADNATDVAPAIEKAFSSCAITGGATIFIPPGTYSRKSLCTTLYAERLLTSLSTNGSCSQQRKCLRSPDRRSNRPDFRRKLCRQRIRSRKRKRHRSVLQQRLGSHRWPRIHHSYHWIGPKRPIVSFHFLHGDLDP
jgi:hypothetical protein